MDSYGSVGKKTDDINLPDLKNIKFENETVKEYIVAAYYRTVQLMAEKINDNDGPPKDPPGSPEGLGATASAILEKTGGARAEKEKLFENEFIKAKKFIDDYNAKKNISRKNYGRDNYEFIIELAILEINNKAEYHDKIDKYILNNLDGKNQVALINSAAEYLRKNNLVAEARLFIQNLDAFTVNDGYKDHLEDMDKENIDWLRDIETELDKQKQKNIQKDRQSISRPREMLNN